MDSSSAPLPSGFGQACSAITHGIVPERPANRSSGRSAARTIHPSSGPRPAGFCSASRTWSTCRIRAIWAIGSWSSSGIAPRSSCPSVATRRKSEPNSYTRAHARTLQPVIDLATLAVEHDHLRTLTEERLLGPARGQLYSRLKRYGLTRAKR